MRGRGERVQLQGKDKALDRLQVGYGEVFLIKLLFHLISQKQLCIEQRGFKLYLGRGRQETPFGQPLFFQNRHRSNFVHSSPYIAAEAHIESKLLVPSI